MALVAKMVATQVTVQGGDIWIACSPDDEGAISLDDDQASWVTKTVYTDPPQWLLGTGYIKQVRGTQANEAVELNCVSVPKGSDPDKTNAQWAYASPSGRLTLTIANPHAFGKIKPGREYRVTIEEVVPARRRDQGASSA